jgi:phosphotransacetylase
MAGAKAVGPLLVGFDKPVCILPLGTTVENIVNMAAIMAIAAIHPSTLGSAPEAEDLRPVGRA